MVERKRLSTIETFSIVTMSVATAAVVTKLVSFALSAPPDILFVGAVTQPTIYGGAKVGAPCLIATALVINYFFITPLYALTLADSESIRASTVASLYSVGWQGRVSLRRSGLAIHQSPSPPTTERP